MECAMKHGENVEELIYYFKIYYVYIDFFGFKLSRRVPLTSHLPSK
jgi:hypothetical protein